MAKFGSILRKTTICAAAALMVGSFTAAQLISLGEKGQPTVSASASAGETITDMTGKVASDLASSFDTKVVRKLPSGIDADREISVIVRTTDTTLVSAYDAQNAVSRYASVAAFADSSAGAKVVSRIEKANEKALSRIKKAGVNYELGATYDTVIGGFELVVKAEEYEKIVSALDGTDALPSISEEYAPAEATLVENDVNVYDTGIFDSSDSEYRGEGTLIAVLDTGFDYTHSVLDPEVFAREVDESKLYMTRTRLDGLIGDLKAAKYTRGLSSEKVYVNDKIPYAYDYADKDTDVYPLDSEHGTHVAGIILGNNEGSSKNGKDDPKIVGVAPLAQLAAMKVFSDTASGAKQSWITAAIEDCVKLGVDVINMSLGMSAGFTEEDDDTTRIAYENVGKAGISLVAAASNDYSSTFGSAKNGNLGLTSNPDTATVGTPSTYRSALSVASISGVKTSYIKYGKEIMYFHEASDSASEPMDFVDAILTPYGVDTKVFEYVTIPGIGASADYTGLDMTGKIALVRRGSNSFEEKARVALEDMHAAGIIIYNNVSGDISMTVGGTKGAICSISQDNGEILAKNKTGKITISRSQVAGPFMSDFSSWGPTPDLRIKPEITAHGGDILSAVPGQKYDRLSGTSMASPNQAGVTAILREYVKQNFHLTTEDSTTRKEVAARVNQIMMSTADIAYNTNGLPYAVRKQGAGLANLTEALATPAYITTYERNDGHLYDGSPRFLVDDEHIMDKAKLEYGDDPERTGVYDLVFTVNNFSNKSLTYKIGALVQTEGVSETLTVRGDSTVTEKGYKLSPKVTVPEVNGSAHKDNSVTVKANGTATVTVRIELSDKDKQYLERSFANGMYVEGFVTLKASKKADIDLNVPFLAFYGDWTEAPLFDLDYFETNPDELDSAIDQDDKTMPDAYATQPIGSIEGDYIMYLGSFPFVQDPAAKQVAASREHIALTNQRNSNGVNSLYAVWAGMLRASKYVDVTITDTSTGEVVWSKTETNIRKTYGNGSAFFNSTVDIGFSIPEHDLKNNTKYMVRLEGYLDYGSKDAQNNKRNVFEFPFVTDFQAPVVTGVDFYTEVDKTDPSAPKTRTYARVSVYDNHYAAGAFFGYMKLADPGSEYMLDMPGFSNYPTTISASSINSTTDIIFELTDHMKEISTAAHPNTFTVQLFDYALNISTFEIKVPDNVTSVEFTGDMVTTDAQGTQTITLSPNQKYILDPTVYPATEWANALYYSVDNESVAKIVGNRLVGVAQGTANLKVTRKYNNSMTDLENIGSTEIATVKIVVLGEDEEGYQKLDSAGVSSFRLTSYTTDNAFYMMSSKDRDIGKTGDETLFPSNTSNYGLSMYPSEKVTISYELLSFESGVEVVFKSNNPRIATVTDGGQIEALREGSTSIEVSVKRKGTTLVGAYVTVVVKNPYERNGPYLTGYRGIGGFTDGVPNGVVDIAKDLGEDHGLTAIEQFAFSHYDYVPKGPEDVIDEEDPYASKIWYVGENDHIKEVIIPEGVEMINMYAFAGMDGLEKVVLPSTLKQIGVGAFLNCPKLKVVEGLEYVQLINQDAFRNTGLLEAKLSNVIAVGNYAFANTKLGGHLELPASAQSIGAYAFSGLRDIDTLVIRASSVKLGEGAFANDTNLMNIPTINAANIPENLFGGDTRLVSVTLGKDVESIDRNAFKGTGIQQFNVAQGNMTFKASDDHRSLFRISEWDEVELLCVVPTITGKYSDNTVTKVGAGAFAGLGTLTSVDLPNAKEIGESAFYDCPKLTSVTLGALTEVPAYAFCGTSVKKFDFKNVASVGAYAFFGSQLSAVELPANVTVGAYAFAAVTSLRTVTVNDGATLGDYAFANGATLGVINADKGYDSLGFYEIGYAADTSNLTTVTLGNDVTVGNFAFAFHNRQFATLKAGSGVVIGDNAFFLCQKLTTASLEGVASIGAYAFAGVRTSLAALEGGALDYYSDNFDVQSGGLRSVTLTAATKIGAYAFAFNSSLATVTLGNDLKEIAPYAFFGTGIATINLENIETVGDYAFAAQIPDSLLVNIQTGQNAIDSHAIAATTLDLSGAVSIGAHAFENAASLQTVTLPAPAAEGDAAPAALAGTTIGAYAFAGDTKLSDVNNLGNVSAIGAHAFEHTALKGTLDLGKVGSIGDLAFAYNTISAVTFGDGLKDIGDNPFAGNPTSFAKKGETTYDIGETISVIGGVLYRKTEFAGGDLRGVRTVNGANQYYLYGLELIAYPQTLEDKEYTVAEGTVRIAAGAFMGNEHIERVNLPESLAAIGDKAFYGAKKLSIIVFTSLNAPILEEQYDESYQFYGNTNNPNSNLPGNYIQSALNGHDYTDLGIIGSGISMWFADATSFFYGANFVDHIGKAAGDLIMVRPKNGAGYENFIYGQYFDTVLNGAVAADATTRSVIRAITALPDARDVTEYTLASYRSVIDEARALYDAITSDEQRALVSNYQKLRDVEEKVNTIAGGLEPTPPAGPTEGGADMTTIALAVVCGVLGAAVIVMASLLLSRKKGKDGDENESNE